MTHQRASQGVGPVPSVAVLTHLPVGPNHAKSAVEGAPQTGLGGQLPGPVFCAICPDAPNDDSLGDELCRRTRAGVSWACNRLEANMSPETKADLLRAVTDFYDVMRGSLDDAELDERSREALLDFLQALSDASAELMRKLRPQH